MPSPFLVFDVESIPDGRLLALAKYPGQTMSPEQAVARAQQEARSSSSSGSDFLPATFQIPVAICVLEANPDFTLRDVACLDAPQFRTRSMVEAFWERQRRVRSSGGGRLVTFNGEGFDWPLLEVAAFRYGIAAPERFADRERGDDAHLDLFRWLTNNHAFRLAGGLNLLSKLLGKPGKFETRGDQVYRLHCEGKIQAINDYCLFDTLDTYFVLLRTRVLAGDLSLDDEHQRVVGAKIWLEGRVHAMPALATYLENWGDWDPWP